MGEIVSDYAVILSSFIFRVGGHRFRSKTDGFAGRPGDGLEHAPVNPVMKGLQGVPVQEPPQAPGQKPGYLAQFRAALRRCG